MKFHVAVFAFVCLFICSITAPCTVFAWQQPTKKIEAVETGLTNGTAFKGDKRFTIAQRMKHYNVPGMSIAVIKDNQVVWSKAYGVKDRESGEPTTTDTLFQCASISKPVSAAAALRLVEQNVFDLNRDVNDYLKSWKLPENEFTKDKKVTLEHLLSHTGGLTVHGFLGYNHKQKVPTLIELLDGTGPANSDPIRVDKIPGGTFRYSGGGYCVLQQMMQDQTGKSFPESMNELILSPLGMTHCTFEHPLPESRVAEVATGYVPSGEKVKGGRHIYPEMAPAGLYATSSELAQFWIELSLACQGKSTKILSQAMARQMVTVVDEMGLGVGVSRNGSEVYLGHGGWNEGFVSNAVVHRDQGYGVIVLTNGNKPDLIDEVVASVARAYQWDAHGLPEFEKLAITEPMAKKLIGRYNHAGNLLTISNDGNRLFLQASGNEPVEVFRVGENQFACSKMDDVIYVSTDEPSKQSSLSFKKPWDEKPHPSNVAKMMTPEEKLPVELVMEGKFDEATDAFLDWQKRDPENPSIHEDRLNQLGYELLANEQLEKALAIFKINVQLYPNAFNAFDSLGEAYLIQGETELGIENYKKSLELNPNNTNASDVLAKLKSK